MSGFKSNAKRSATRVTEHRDKEVRTFEGGTNYKISPLEAAKLSLASGICGEPQFYRPKGKATPVRVSKYNIFGDELKSTPSQAEFQEQLIDAALEHDFKGTLELGRELRSKYMMRLNPSVLFVRAAIHKDRAKFNEENGDFMKRVGVDICQRADDPINQFGYFCYTKGGKKNLPSILKRVWKETLEALNRYRVNKYKGTGSGASLIDVVRISHAHNEIIDELMRTGTVKVEETDMTWEMLRSQGKSWTEIWKQLGRLPHMALLRNLRGMFKEIDDKELAKEILATLVEGVEGGKQFPFRYLSAYREIDGTTQRVGGWYNFGNEHQADEAEIHFKSMVLDALEECMEEAVKNLPVLPGRTVCLSDASSSMGQRLSEKSSVTCADVAVLSGITSAMVSEDGGEVIMFEHNFKRFTVKKKAGILSQAKAMIEWIHGGGTELQPPVRDMINRKDKFDNMFVFTDMQIADRFLPIIEEYRRKVNPDLNVFVVQIGGYNTSVIPEHLYRGSILTGWTGKEPEFAKAVIDIWDEITG